MLKNLSFLCKKTYWNSYWPNSFAEMEIYLHIPSIHRVFALLGGKIKKLCVLLMVMVLIGCAFYPSSPYLKENHKMGMSFNEFKNLAELSVRNKWNLNQEIG